MNTPVNIVALRQSYAKSGLSLAQMPATPWPLFSTWFAQITASGIFEPNAMIVATASTDAQPSQRTVLLKAYDTQGFTFYTNYTSRKGQQLRDNDQVSLLFPWISLHRQVIVQGLARKVSREDSLAYFQSRPRGSQIGAWASAQSTVIASRAQLIKRAQQATARFADKTVELPPYWGGFKVFAQRIEFWQGRENRLHDRFSYCKEEENWRIERLSP